MWGFYVNSTLHLLYIFFRENHETLDIMKDRYKGGIKRRYNCLEKKLCQKSIKGNTIKCSEELAIKADNEIRAWSYSTVHRYWFLVRVMKYIKRQKSMFITFYSSFSGMAVCLEIPHQMTLHWSQEFISSSSHWLCWKHNTRLGMQISVPCQVQYCDAHWC